jgi:Putative transmembrane protein (Alph_Pro_TM)
MGCVGSKRSKVCWVCAGFLLVVLWGEVPAAPAELIVSPNVVRIGTWYDGAKIRVRALIPQDCQAVLELKGEPTQTRLMRKEKVWGMWKNGEELLERGAPSFYLAMSTDPKLLSRSNKYPSWGYEAISGRISFTGGVGNMAHRQLFDEFLRLKENRGRYGIFPGRASILALPGKRQMVEGVFNLPSRLPRGDYHVVLSVVKNGRVVSKEIRPLKVALAGFPSAIFELAHKHALAYGILAAGIAILSGFLVGLIFQFIGKKE